MADKLSEAVWTAFAKKRNLDDAALVKSLARLDKIDATKHQERIEALDEVLSQSKKLHIALAKRAKELGDKPFKEAKDRLNELLDEAEKQQKALRAEKDRVVDDGEGSPALLSTKMVPLLRELRKGEARMHALIALVGKETGVLIAQRAISPARRKLVAEAAGGTGAPKFIVGDCGFENGVLTFVVQSPAGGLAKRLRTALLVQTELRLKVRVRGEDGEDSDGDEDAEQPAAASPVPSAPPQPGAPAPAPSVPAQAWARRLPDVKQRLAQALRAPHPEAPKLRKLIDFASDKASQHDHAAAVKALDMLEQLLGAPQPPARPAEATSRPTATPAPAPGPVSASAEGKRSIAPAIVYTQSRLVWGATRSKIKNELGKLEQAILAHYKGEAAMPEIIRSVRKLDGVLSLFDDSLSDALDHALNAKDAGGKQKWHDEARAIIGRYQAFLSSDPVVQELDGNPFVPIAVQSTLATSLSKLAAQIV